jgi:hypothetical protein
LLACQRHQQTQGGHRYTCLLACQRHQQTQGVHRHT